LDIDPQRKGSFASGSRCLCQISSKSVKNCDRESADRQTDRDDTGDLIICPMLCYSNGTDKNKVQLKVNVGKHAFPLLARVRLEPSSAVQSGELRLA